MCRTIDQYLCCPWFPKSSNVASTTNSYHIIPVNSTIFNSVSSETGQPSHSFCMFSKIFIKGWRVETKWTLYLNFAKAFDKVSYKLLLAKFQKFGIRGDLVYFGLKIIFPAAWCTTWKMDLNKSKCGVMSFTSSHQPVITEYELRDSPLKQTCHQKDLGIVVTIVTTSVTHIECNVTQLGLLIAY